MRYLGCLHPSMYYQERDSFPVDAVLAPSRHRRLRLRAAAAAAAAVRLGAVCSRLDPGHQRRRRLVRDLLVRARVAEGAAGPVGRGRAGRDDQGVRLTEVAGRAEQRRDGACPGSGAVERREQGGWSGERAGRLGGERAGRLGGESSGIGQERAGRLERRGPAPPSSDPV